jgi:phosphate transport system protein
LRHFSDELGILQHDLLVMGGLVVASIQRSVRCLLEQNAELGHQVIQDEIRINEMEIELDDFVATLVVRNQPVARDMRLLLSVLKINSDLERMGDLAVNIAQRSVVLVDETLPDSVEHIVRMAALVEDMVRLALEAFVQKNSAMAYNLLKHDDEVDAVRDLIYEEALSVMHKGPEFIVIGLGMMSVARNLERIADHSTNIAEDVIFAVQGADVRHHREPRPA